MNEEIKKEEAKPKETTELRGTIGLTMEKQLIVEIKRRAEKAGLSMSRYVEITLKKALRI